jgi:hydroxymethylglutaryl-CoA synthase
MIGIKSFSAYIPYFRLDRTGIGKAWSKPSGKGEKAVANSDEDSITMAVNAALDCISGHDDSQIDELYFASTSFPYLEKQSAALISAAMGMRREIFTADFSGTLRSCMSAIKTGVNAIKAGSAENVVVTTADMRKGYPRGSFEIDSGDGAAAFLLGNDKVIAEITGSYCISDEIVDVWRSDKDIFVQSWEDRFAREKGYLNVLTEAVTNALKKYDLATKDISKAVFYAPDAKALDLAAKKIGLDPAVQVQNSMYDLIGNTGSALSPMLLCAALEKASPGDKILWAGYGDGCEVYILKVTEEITDYKVRRSIDRQLLSKQNVSYQKYLSWKEILPVDPPARPPLEKPSAVALWRDAGKGLCLTGSRCNACGTMQYPAQRVCVKCHKQDDFKPYCFADKLGRIVTFSHDNLAATVDPPSTVAVVDFDEGGRIMCDITDRDPENIKVGMPVEMTFRKVRYAGSIYNYWWKCRPLR